MNSNRLARIELNVLFLNYYFDMSTIGFVSLGCPKALVDSEQIITQLRSEGYTISPTYQGADLVVVNTCGFINEAVQESLDAIGEAIVENGKVVVTGCLGVRKNAMGENLITSLHPKVLAVTGPQAFKEILEVIHQHVPRPHNPFIDLIPPAGIKLTPRHYAYLKIAEGCNHQCTFCIIPSMRGKLVSRPIHDVLTEAEKLFQSGVKELLIISQDTSAYGVDVKWKTEIWKGRPIKTRMTELVDALGEIAASYQAWVRLHYIYPYPHVDELLPLMADGKILPYLDIPLQHAHPDVLRRMKRPGNIEKTLQRIENWRAICPELTIRSTFIAGFPGETEEEFETLLNFIREAKLDRVGCFAYSPIEGATANQLEGALPESIRHARRDEFMAVAEAVSAKKIRSKIGKNLRVLIDEVSPEGAIARSYADAPEIDGIVYLPPGNYKVGSFANVKITGADKHDLWGEVLI